MEKPNVENTQNRPIICFCRKAMVEIVLIEKKTKVAAAEKFNFTPATVSKWVKRLKEEGESGLEYRSLHPHNSPRATPVEKVQEIITMRK